MPDFRKQILDQMELKGISRMLLASKAKVHYLTVCRYIAGANCLDETLLKILDALDLDLIIKPRSKQDA